MKHTHEPIEGPEASARFDALVTTGLAVSHDEIMRRDAQYQLRRAIPV